VTGSAPYRDLGLDGSGLTIAVIDGGFTLFGAAQTEGDAPPPSAVVLFDYTGDAVFAAGGVHGTACVETIYEHAPGASYRLYKVDSLIDLNTAVADAIANGVDVISHSLSWFNTGWADNSGQACAAANAAAAAGILFFTAAGNRARQHWQGDFVDLDGDTLHEWSGTDTGLDIAVPPGGTANLYLSWDPVTGPMDYDLLLVDGAGTTLASSAAGPGTYEALFWTNTGFTTVTTRVQVKKISGASTEIELFLYPENVTFDLAEYAMATNSTTSPSNATHPNVVSMGAVPYNEFTRANYSFGIIARYSGNGPSNDGMLLPDLVGPTNTRSLVYDRFGGTSCATPNAAGFAAVLWSCDPAELPAVVLERIRDWADCERDFGARGPDMTYGNGGCWLPEYANCNGNSQADACDILSGASADANCNGIVDDLLCDVDELLFRVPPIVQNFDSFSGLGPFVALPEISEAPWVSGWPTPWAGFSMGISHDPGLLMPTQVLPSDFLKLLGGGQGPDFFAPQFHAAGVTVGVVFDLLNQELVEFESSEAVLAIGYMPDPQQLAGQPGLVERSFEFVDTLGNPVVLNSIADAQGAAFLPAVQGGTVKLEPKGFVQVDLPAVLVAIDGSALDPPEFRFVPMIEDTRAGTTAPVTSWSIAVKYDPAVLQPTAVELSSELQALNGGNGPTVSTFGFAGDRIVFQMSNNAPLTLSPAMPLAIFDFQVTAAALAAHADDFSTIVSITDLGGNPPIPSAIVFSNNTFAPLAHLPAVIDFDVAQPAEFIRADCNASGGVNISDPIFALEYLFIAGSAIPPCQDACDANDDGLFVIADPIFVLNFLFSGGAPPPAPFPACGEDSTASSLECDQGPACP
jgi:hypothetical protein